MKVYVEIYKNMMTIKAGNETTQVYPATPFSSLRLLVADFDSAADCLKGGLDDLNVTGFLKFKPIMYIYPRELTDGGVSEVEKKVLRELGAHCQAKKVIIE